MSEQGSQVGRLMARIEELERENAELKRRLASAIDVDPTAGKDPNFKWDGDG